jgi:hypothetical protein
LDRLILTNCRWWTIELDDYQEILHTYTLAAQYPGQKKKHILAVVRSQTDAIQTVVGRNNKIKKKEILPMKKFKLFFFLFIISICLLVNRGWTCSRFRA